MVANLRADLLVLDDVLTLDRPVIFAAGKDRPILFGLFKHTTGPDGSRWRIFYVPMGGTKKTAEETPGQ